MIFVLQRKPDTSRQECLESWASDHDTSIVGGIPWLARRVRDQVVSASAVCDAIRKLWFDSDEAGAGALTSPGMAASVRDAQNFLAEERTGLITVEKKTVIRQVAAA